MGERRNIGAGGPFTVADVDAAGITRAHLRAQVRAGRWVRLRQQVYVTAADRAVAASDPRTLHAQDVLALELAMQRKRVVAAAESAARIYGMEFLTQPTPEIRLLTDDPGVAGTHRDGYFLRHGQLPDDHLRRCYGVGLTSPARTAFDLAANLDFANATVLTESAFRLRLLRPDDLPPVLDWGQGHPGVNAARDVFAFADPRTESVLESFSRVRMRELGVVMPLTQVVLIKDPREIRVDFFWPHLRLAGEPDGMTKYVDLVDRRRTLDVIREERDREQRLRDAGIDIVRWDWKTVNDPKAFAQRLHAAFARAAERLQGRTS